MTLHYEFRLASVLAFIVILLLLIIIGSFFLPKSAHVERSAAINASSASVFALGCGDEGLACRRESAT